MRRLGAFLAVYAILLVWLVPALPLSIDEILDVFGSRLNRGALIDHVAATPGGVPGGYFIRAAFLQTTKAPEYGGRLPSVLASLIACAGVFLIAKRAGCRSPLFATIVFAALPLQMRYALEARGYETGLCAAVWATVVFLGLIEHPRDSLRWAAYALLTAAGLYTQPYSVFVPAAHWIWSATSRRDLIAAHTVAMIAAGALFAPWYAYTAGWSEGLKGVEGGYAFSARSLLLLAHEFPGMGYAGAALLLLGAGAGLAWSVKGRSRWLWILMAVMPVALALFFDGIFGYFLAVRQIMFGLFACAVLFALGVEALAARNRIAGWLLAAVFLGGAVYANQQFFTRRVPDWESAATKLSEHAASGACVLFEPADFDFFYTFFEPELDSHKCSAPGEAPAVAVAISSTPAGKDPGLAAAGYRRAEATPEGFEPRIELYRR